MLKTGNIQIIVVGGGSAGIAAAYAAAKAGMKVLLVERGSYLGGKATSAEVGTICGLYKYSKASPSEYIVNGFVRDFAEELGRLSKEEPLHNQAGLHYLPYNISAYKELCARIMRENQVEVFYRSEVSHIEISEGCVTTVTIKRNEREEIQFQCGAVIDCSGNSCVSELANLPLIIDNYYQAAAQIFTVQGMTPTPEPVLNLLLLRELKRGISRGQLKEQLERVYVVHGSVKQDTASFKLAVPLAVTHEKNNVAEIRELAVELIHELVSFFVQHVGIFRNASLLSIAPEVGIRVGVRPVGKYILNEDDVLRCKKFDSAIANGAWPIEEWGDGRVVKMQYFVHDDFYQIPADCLKSNTIKNLFFAGRNISATSSAIASARVMGICLQTGYAAGMLATNFIQKGSENDVIHSIQQTQILA